MSGSHAGAVVLAAALALFAAAAPGATAAAPAARPAVSDSLSWPEAREWRHRRPIAVYADSAAGTVTTSVVVEKGKYLLWMQRPRVTVASARRRDMPDGEWPDLVYIEFRTQSPQYTATNLLTLTTGDTVRMEARATGSRVHQRTLVTDHTLTFELPLADFLHFVHDAPSATFEVGGVRVKLKEEQLNALRAFALRVRDAGAVVRGAG